MVERRDVLRVTAAFAAEGLVALGRSDAVAAWVEGYARGRAHSPRLAVDAPVDHSVY